MTDPTPSELGKQLTILIDRAVDGRILDEEADNLRAAVLALTQDRREPVDKLQLAEALRQCLPTEINTYLNRIQRINTADRLLRMAVVTKLPHRGWGKSDG